MCACKLVTAPRWEIVLQIYTDYFTKQRGFPLTLNLPVDVLHTVYSRAWRYRIVEEIPPLRAVFHMQKPEDVPAYAIWRVFTELNISNSTSLVSIEVLTDNHHSSSVYEWNQFRSPDGVYITIDKTVNIIIEAVSLSHLFAVSIEIWFIRHFLHDDKISKYITGQAPQQNHFSFHNHR